MTGLWSRQGPKTIVFIAIEAVFEPRWRPPRRDPLLDGDVFADGLDGLDDLFFPGGVG